ncbi:MAG: hypothetical protein ACD_70C00110G0004 [uncultured bacterium]|nr:MAG: hypothetical protein ACD_70C00110G0004 [uncultured bacterium]OGT25376.1 MAG: AAA family ATPase [Gammaproteobacteria bacterium RIFCSPHIGHO2_02_FULL_42_43]OGT29111.1 MAG: AAA family ATPase [Gammaproteobacteria bacterium RIFCSPHIGHO2_01_FULL_42_8]OGT51327.1 MAG: AAA family ATPase [Gammaproteobacteria bacterium RIFCSPHIGHO2_12_FULL_41_25]OGT62029.1 MAG: AAA family ATPase [Gammaproteobacteria bacterium RIFCSPLOWO2_02_FULL_42_14]OGT85702.1 MAG: AAA family ATPase [Gammaproteobacteria bacteriu
MRRLAITYLKNQWIKNHDRKPLVIRGARQVGKTWLVREFAKTIGKTLLEINFEETPAIATLFESNDPAEILLQLSVKNRRPIDVAKSLLFLDEIQAAPEILAKLRWFAENLPELPVIAAGSLLEFVLAKHEFSMPVGRIDYLHLEPVSFEEFLLAQDEQTAFDYLQTINFSHKVPLALHKQLLTQFREYLFVGGLPAAVSNWITKRDWSSINRIHQNVLTTYRDDFSKYHGRLEVARLEETLLSVPKMLGEKFIYSHVNSSVQSSSIKNALELLHKARLCHSVRCVNASGVPIAATVKEKYFKEIVLDVGLCNAMLGVDLHEMLNASELTLIHSGGLTEQITGQLLRTIFPFYVQPELFYWAREEKNASAEIDYVIQHHNKIIPIEVKAGATGSLKSLHYFMGLKKLSLALRINSDVPSETLVSVKHEDKKIQYTLLSLPLYLIGQIPRFLK